MRLTPNPYPLHIPLPNSGAPNQAWDEGYIQALKDVKTWLAQHPETLLASIRVETIVLRLEG